jgi:hypothetical protein
LAVTGIGLSSGQVAQLVELLSTLAAAPGLDDDDRYQLHHCRAQLGRRMPAVEVLVLAGVLHDATDQPALSGTLRAACARWSADLARLLRPAPTGAPALYSRGHLAA